jgi:peptidyl-prolyl cis-trans isomerase A (cyclophilin A)
MRCKLFEDKAPITVANFVGLARGVRPYQSPTSKGWVKKPLYDGTTFHRIIKGFMIQGGDPEGTGMGQPGYVIPDEIWVGGKHDHAGQLCMANRGPNTNGAQFFITDAAVSKLDGKYTIFGDCSPASVVRTIASVPKNDDDRPNTPVRIDKVTISREPNPGQ